jgi:hypothetical protein
MSANRIKLVLAGIVIFVMAVLMLWFPGHVPQAAFQRIIDQADSDVAAAKAAADSAAASAAKAKESARDTQSRLPGSS